ncbi:hypothetical protein K8I31_17985, partial [bacterium]|nr:hypothetical protein [bacterium]
FQSCASQFIKLNLDEFQNKSAPFEIINKIYKAAVGDRQTTLLQGNVKELNRRMLIETKKSLASAVDRMKNKAEKQRKEFHAIWASITALTNTVKNLEELNRMDELESNSLSEKTPTNKDDNNAESEATPKSRMARYLNTFKNS